LKTDKDLMKKRNLSNNPPSKILKPGFLLRARNKPEKVKTTSITSNSRKPGILKKDFKKSQNKVTKVTFLNDEEPVKILGDRTNSSKTHCPAITRTKIKPAQQEDENDSDSISIKTPVSGKTFSFSEDINNVRLSASPILTSEKESLVATPRRLMKIIQTPPPSRVLINMRVKTTENSETPIKKLEFSTSEAPSKIKDIKTSTHDVNFTNNPNSLKWILNKNQQISLPSEASSSELIRVSGVIQTRYMPDGRPSCSRIPLIEAPRMSEGPRRVLISEADYNENNSKELFKKPTAILWKQKSMKNLNRKDQISTNRNTISSISSISSRRPFTSNFRKTDSKPKLSLYEPSIYQPMSKLESSSKLTVKKRCGSKPKDDFVEETVTPAVLNHDADKSDFTFNRVVEQLSKQMGKIKRKSMKVEFESAIKLLQKSHQTELKTIEEETATTSRLPEKSDLKPSPSDVTHDSLDQRQTSLKTSKEKKDQITSDLCESFKNYQQLATNQPESLSERLLRFRLDNKSAATKTTSRNQLR